MGVTASKQTATNPLLVITVTPVHSIPSPPCFHCQFLFSTSTLSTCCTLWMAFLYMVGWIMTFPVSTHNTPEASLAPVVIIKTIYRLWKAFSVNQGEDTFLSILLVVATVTDGCVIVSLPLVKSSFSAWRGDMLRIPWGHLNEHLLLSTILRWGGKITTYQHMYTKYFQQWIKIFPFVFLKMGFSEGVNQAGSLINVWESHQSGASVDTNEELSNTIRMGFQNPQSFFFLTNKSLTSVILLLIPLEAENHNSMLCHALSLGTSYPGPLFHLYYGNCLNTVGMKHSRKILEPLSLGTIIWWVSDSEFISSTLF